jgi:gamma-glutamyltranspeptidase/glutathione hydrolase
MASFRSIWPPLLARPVFPFLLGGLVCSLILPDAFVKAQQEPVVGRHGLVVTVSAPASEIGVAILKKGGNAVDAAVATALALAVTYPQAGNIGGGGFMMVAPGQGKKPVCIEYRETAPAAATRDMFARGHDQYGHQVVGVPGTVRGLALAHQKFGKLPWPDLVLPAVELAEKGFAVDAHVARDLNRGLKEARSFPEFQRVFGKKSGAAWRSGDRLVQPDLARTLRQIAEQGPNAFYTGAIADQLVAEMKSADGLITKKDLVAYRAHVRTPIHGVYRGYAVYGPPPPSSGGTCLVEMLHILENFDLKRWGRWSPETNHILIEAMRRGFLDRARYLGDPNFVTIPAHLTTAAYGRKLAGEINLTRATPSRDLARELLAGEGDSTTHFSIIDRDGMAVSNTYTLERSFGSRVVVKGAGFLLNNEMGDFNWTPGRTNRKGAIGTPANQIAPGKRMLSSMTPTLVYKDGRLVLVTGSPGGRTIINTVLCVVVNFVEFQMDLRSAIAAPRLHHQWFPDEAHFEGVSKNRSLVKQLQQMGHTIVPNRQGDAHSIAFDPTTGRYIGVADDRLSGKAARY